jgi:hypothetical protein
MPKGRTDAFYAQTALLHQYQPGSTTGRNSRRGHRYKLPLVLSKNRGGSARNAIG